MQIHVHLFSILRDCLPPDAEARGPSGGKATIALPDRATLVDLVMHLGIDRYLGYAASELASGASWQVMVSGRFELDMERVLQDGDEVRILPPASGG
jgi:molybdopterin converting factor small subunit